MSVSDSFRAFALEQVQPTVPEVHARSMFGGVGVYAGDLFFGLMDDDILYFKVDDSNRGRLKSGHGPSWVEASVAVGRAASNGSPVGAGLLRRAL